jgi:hypothetical protein
MDNPYALFLSSVWVVKIFFKIHVVNTQGMNSALFLLVHITHIKYVTFYLLIIQHETFYL